MGGPSFDESIPFKGLRIAIMTVSDTRTEETDKSGALLVERAQEAGHHVMDKVIVPDDRKRIEVQLRRWINEPNVEVIIATGGTGVTDRTLFNRRDRAILFESDFRVGIPLRVSRIVIMLPVVYTADRPSGSFGEQGCNELGAADEPVAIFASLEGGAAVELVKMEIIHGQQLKRAPGGTYTFDI